MTVSIADGGAVMAHTPGPWLVHSTNRLIVKAKDAFGNASVKGNKVEADFIPLCLLRDPTDDFSEDETLANGFLIAAAPELFEAAEALAGMTCQTTSAVDAGSGCCPVCRARAALAKARGEQ